MRELGSGTTYNTHNTISLIRTLKYVSDILQTEEAFTVKGYKHTHTHTPSHLNVIHHLQIFSVLRKLRETPQITFTYSKSIIETVEKSVKYIRSYQSKHQNDVSDVALVFLW